MLVQFMLPLRKSDKKHQFMVHALKTRLSLNSYVSVNFINHSPYSSAELKFPLSFYNSLLKKTHKAVNSISK